MPPSPPAPPTPPPSPPQPPRSPSPRAPPPAVKYVERLRELEQESDPNCELVDFATCSEIVRQFAQRSGAGYSPRLRVTASGCEGVEVESDCFLGCAYGTRGGGQYRFLPGGSPALYHMHTKPRCRLSDHPRCACANLPPPPPIAFAPPPPRKYAEDWEIVNPPQPRDSSRGAIGAMVQRMVNGRTLDLSLRSGPMHRYECPGESDGRDTCALTCATNHLSRLRAFTVTGEAFEDPPPPPSPSSPPPRPPPPFAASMGDRFNGCQNTCTAIHVTETLCRDGGMGSFSPALCAYGTSCALCGPREEVRSVQFAVEGDDACAYANDGICQDGRESTPEKPSAFVHVDGDAWTHVCGFLRDATDCGPGTISSITEDSFTLAPMPPLPKPPPPDPHPPPLPPPPIGGCRYSCADTFFAVTLNAPPATNATSATSDVHGFCSDGGPNSVPIAHDAATGSPIFMCDFGTQCSSLECGPRSVSQSGQPICSDACRPTIANGVKFVGASSNGICEDGGDQSAHTSWYAEPPDYDDGTLSNWTSAGYLRIAGCGFGTHQRSTPSPRVPASSRPTLSDLSPPHPIPSFLGRHRLHRLRPAATEDEGVGV